MKKWLEGLSTAGQSIAVYVATLLGVLLAQYAPLLLTHEKLDSAFDWVRLGISCGVALYLVAGQEEGGEETGKRAHFKRRIANALSHGIAWNTLMGIAGTAARQ